MLSKNKNNGNGFDKFLKDSLKQYHQPVPVGFQQRMLDRLEQFEQQKALKQVVRRERALLVVLILLPIAGVILILMFPNLLLVSSQLQEALSLLAKETAANMVQQWRLWISYATAATAVIYAVYECLLAEN